jgi:hypothetical protein
MEEGLQGTCPDKRSEGHVLFFMAGRPNETGEQILAIHLL